MPVRLTPAPIPALCRTWRYLQWRHLAAALAVGALIALLVTLATLHLNLYWTPWKLVFLTPQYVAFAGIFVLAIAAVEANAPRRRPRLRHYVLAGAVASAICLAEAVLLKDFWPVPPVRVVHGTQDGSTRYEPRHRLPVALFATGLDGVVHCWIGMFVYVRLRNARFASDALQRAQLRASETTRCAMSARLKTAHDLIDPDALSRALEEIESAYWVDPARAEGQLDDLIEFLRAAIPQVRDEDAPDDEPRHLVAASTA